MKEIGEKLREQEISGEIKEEREQRGIEVQKMKMIRDKLGDRRRQNWDSMWQCQRR